MAPSMAFLTLAFLLGVCGLQWQASLPPAPGTFLLAALLGLAVVGRWRTGGVLRFLLTVLMVALLGFTYAAWRAELRLAERLSPALEGQDIEISGMIVSLPQPIERGWRFDFAPDAPTQLDTKLPSRISLAWYGVGRFDDAAVTVPPLNPGDRWRFTVRLKRPHGNANPNGFDFEAWLFERGIGASGYVRPKSAQTLLQRAAGAPVERLRAEIRQRFLTALPEAPYAGVLVALVVGDQQAIPKVQWDVFGQTGITHLMSISGLHVTMLAGLAYALLMFVWRHVPALMLWLPAQRAAALGGALTAFAYCLLAGFGVPAQRTLYMLLVVMLALWLRRRVASRDVLCLALLVVLLIDPWAVLAAGFWLSFGAVALLFYVGSGYRAQPHWLRQWWRTQWALTLAMVPLLLALFQQFSLVSPLANALAIPLVSLVVTPLALLAALPGMIGLLPVAHTLMAWMMQGIEMLAALPYAQWQQAVPPLWLMGIAMFGLLWLWLPRGWSARWIGLLPLPVLLMWPAPRPADGELWLTVLDVGQGLAVHVQTASRDLLFDTGPAYSEEANSGNRIIVPYLRAAGVTELDGMIITHADNDHAGGAESVVEGLPVRWLQSSVPLAHALSALPVPHQPCVAGESWVWDAVRFTLLHPTADDYASRSKSNDMSCVLRLDSAHGSALLTADIEAKSEQHLLGDPARQSAPLQADVLVVPHHGSKSSSTPAFIDAVAPRVAIFPVGYRNHYRHPHPEVWQRYVERVPALYRTDREGAVTVRYSGGNITVEAARTMRPRYWHTQ